jgi:hypothetical protein
MADSSTLSKHTGERPFKCHCDRRFSRLDNLRQHAQTVHVNEDIPAESLAATGTRFQRQIRTDRVRPAGNRSRANTLGSQGGHSRGHSRNLSTSSTISNASSISVSQVQDVRRRPQPLAMANDGTARARLSLNTMDAYNPPLMGSPGPQIVEYVDYHAQSTGVTTPTSATFSTANGSPSQYGSAFQSPISTSRPVSWGGPGAAGLPGRRLSFQAGSDAPRGPPHGQLPPPFIPPLAASASGQSSMFGSPTGSNFPESRTESNADSDWRRRTWHPGYTGPRPATSGLGYHQTPDSPRPSFTSQPAASQTRLPGIESFDHVTPTALRRPGSPMQMDPPATRPATHYGTPETYVVRGEKRKSISWDTESMQQKIYRLEIASPNPSREQWSHYQRNSGQQSANRPVTAPHPSYMNPQQPAHAPGSTQAPSQEFTGSSQDSPSTPQRSKRHGWYNGPISEQPIQQVARVVQRTSPEDSSSSEGVPTPSGTTMTEYHPAIMHSNGYVEQRPAGTLSEEQKPDPPTSIMDRPHPLHQLHSSPYQHSRNSNSLSSFLPRVDFERRPLSLSQQLASSGARDTRRLDALVAVATSEQQAVADGGR